MDFVSNQSFQVKKMLQEIGINHIEDLFEIIPEHIRLSRPSKDDGISEYECMRLMENLAAKNTYPLFENYLGVGAYEHHIPAIVGHLCSNSTFLTSYTPYQAEASQGTMQIVFEFQSAICALTELDVANGSVYDGASACAEAILMSLRHLNTRTKVLIAESLNPLYRGVINQYLGSHNIQVETIPFLEDGRLNQEALQRHLNTDVASILVQSPNFFGVVEDVKTIFSQAKQVQASTILCANPLAYGLFASAAELGADIAVGDCQPFGIPLQFGGPYAGYVSCKQEFIHQMPGRIVGETIDRQGRRGFALAFQAREQHIRRAKATSNICSNQNISALASLVTMLWYGKKGVKDLALTNYQRAAYLKQGLIKRANLKGKEDVVNFNEFIIEFSSPIEEVLRHFRKHSIEPGLAVGRFFPSLKNCLLVAVTETKSKQQLDKYIELAKEIS